MVVPCRRIQRPHFLGGHFGQQYFREVKLRLEVVLGEFLFFEELFQYGEIVTGIQA